MKLFKRVLIVFIVIGLLTSGVQMGRRFLKEQRNTVVEIVADLEDFSNLATEIGKPIDEVSKKLISAGTTSVAISEKTLNEMEKNGEVILYSGTELKFMDVNFNNTNRNLAELVKNYIEENNLEYSNETLVFTNNKDTYDFLDKSFSYRFPGITKSFSDENFAILINRKIENVRTVGLGLTDADFELAGSLGFNKIIPRIENHENLTEKEIDEIYAQMKKYKVRTIIFGGVTVLGHDYQDEENLKLKYIAEKFSKPGEEITVSIIEKPVETDLESIQRGIKVLAKESGYVNTKVYSVDGAQLAKISAENLVEQWGRAISQRNVRVLYVRPLNRTVKTQTEDFNDTLDSIREIKTRIAYMGMNLGEAKALGTVRQNMIFQSFAVSGISAAAFLLLIMLFDMSKFDKLKKWLYVLFGVSVFGVFGIYCIPALNSYFADLMNKACAFIAAITFSSFGGLYLINVYKKYSLGSELKLSELILKSALMILVAGVIAGIGGFFVGGVLSDSKYILKLDVFRGVKLSFILPLFIFGLAFVLKLGVFCDEEKKPLPVREQFKKLMATPITVKYGAIFAVLALGVVLILLRSGNTLISTTSVVETAIRNFLERVLVARPRTKELIAFPVLMFLIYFANRFKNKEFAFIVMAIGMIGIMDIVNSFCHIRMPIFITGLSTIYSLIFGGIIGSICIVAVDKVWNLIRKSVSR